MYVNTARKRSSDLECKPDVIDVFEVFLALNHTPAQSLIPLGQQVHGFTPSRGFQMRLDMRDLFEFLEETLRRNAIVVTVGMSIRLL